MATSISFFVSFEVRAVDPLGRFSFLTTLRHGSIVAVFWMETVIHVAAEVVRAMKPRAGADEYAASEPVRTVVAIRRASVRVISVVAVRANRSRANSYAHRDLGLRVG